MKILLVKQGSECMAQPPRTPFHDFNLHVMGISIVTLNFNIDDVEMFCIVTIRYCVTIGYDHPNLSIGVRKTGVG